VNITKNLKNNKIMEQYNIYHSIGINKFEEVEDQERIHIGFVYTDSLENAFRLSQNLDNVWNTMDPCRSTSVGDVIECKEGFYMVGGSGFRLLDVMSRNESELNALENQSLEC
jgi:hypothetical protein